MRGVKSVKDAANPLSLLKLYSEILQQWVEGNPAEPGDIPAELLTSPEAVEFACAFAAFSRNYREGMAWVGQIANGELSNSLERDNRSFDALKQLHSSLQHLSWQLECLASGDLSQEVFFLGDFSRSFNTLIQILREKKLLEEKLIRSEAIFRTVFQLAPELVAVFRVDGTIVDVSERALQILGYGDKQEVIGSNMFEHIAPAYREKAARLLGEMLVGHYTGVSEYKLLRRDGSELWVESNAEVVRDAAGNPDVVFTISRDISVRKQLLLEKRERSAERNYENEARFASAFDRAPVGMVIVSLDDRILRVNEYICRMFGYEANEVLGRRVQEMTDSRDVAANDDFRRQMLAGKIDTYCIEKRYRTKSGQLLACTLTASLVRDKHGAPLYFVNQLDDVTEQKQIALRNAVENKRLQSTLRISQMRVSSIEELNDVMLEAVVDLSDSLFGYIYFYDEATEVFSLHAWSKAVMQSCEIADKHTCYQLGETGFWGEAVRQRKPILENDMLAPGSLKKGFPDGHVRLRRFMSVPVFLDGRIVAVVGVANKEEAYTQLDIDQLTLMADSLWNIIERRRAEENLRLVNQELDQRVVERTRELDIAYEQLKEQKDEVEALNDELYRLTLIDSLTRIANRRGFDEVLGREWHAGLRQRKPLSLLLADLDHFKQLNDAYGHQQGDACLVSVAAVLRNTARRNVDFVARYGGEEFVVILPDTDMNGAMIVAESIRKQIEELKFENKEMLDHLVTMSIGVATVIPSTTGSPADLIMAADKALYDAKHAGRNRTCGK
jgi:diguanylate cyclase (GGDEF)-like protein/PAS domain S-box-containing protein